MNIIDIDKVNTTFRYYSDDYQNAEPFPNISLSGLFQKAMLKTIAHEFIDSQLMSQAYKGEIEGGKFTESDINKMGPVTQKFIRDCNSPEFLKALETLTGIDGLVADPKLYGGGLHQTEKNGRLKVHADFNLMDGMVRKLNMLIYLNEGWQEEWGGYLELWNKDMTEAVVRVPPVLGQVAIFTCSDISFHGLPDPISPPDGVYRRSIALYYYKKEDILPPERSTLWKERPGERFL